MHMHQILEGLAKPKDEQGLETDLQNGFDKVSEIANYGTYAQKIELRECLTKAWSQYRKPARMRGYIESFQTQFRSTCPTIQCSFVDDTESESHGIEKVIFIDDDNKVIISAYSKADVRQLMDIIRPLWSSALETAEQFHCHDSTTDKRPANVITLTGKAAFSVVEKIANKVFMSDTLETDIRAFLNVGKKAEASVQPIIVQPDGASSRRPSDEDSVHSGENEIASRDAIKNALNAGLGSALPVVRPLRG